MASTNTGPTKKIVAAGFVWLCRIIQKLFFCQFRDFGRKLFCPENVKACRHNSYRSNISKLQ